MIVIFATAPFAGSACSSVLRTFEPEGTGGDASSTSGSGGAPDHVTASTYGGGTNGSTVSATAKATTTASAGTGATSSASTTSASSSGAGGGASVCGDATWAHGDPDAAKSYAIMGANNELAYDANTRLTWQRDSSAPTRYTWQEALDYCKSGAGLPGSGWRLPTRIELLSLVDSSVAYPGPTLAKAVFPTPTDDFYWTSSAATSLVDDGGVHTEAQHIWFDVGAVQPTFTTATGYARCVR